MTEERDEDNIEDPLDQDKSPDLPPQKPVIGSGGQMPTTSDPLSGKSASVRAAEIRSKARQAKKGTSLAAKTGKNIYRLARNVVRAIRMAWRAAGSLVKYWPVWLGIGFVLLIIILVVSLTSSIGGIGPAVDKLLGKGSYEKFGLTEKQEKQFREEIGEEAAAAFDCSNFPPAERRPGIGGNCIEGLITAFQQKSQGYFSPIPKSATWMMPIYRGAGKHYSVPWSVLAAVNGARSNFGNPNCADNPSGGVGFMRTKENLWADFSVDAGKAKLERATATGACQSADKPFNIGKNYKKKASPKRLPSKANIRANFYDPVDAIYTEGNTLAAFKAYNTNNQKSKNQTEWPYTGSPANACTPPRGEGKILYPPVPSFDLAGNLASVPGGGRTLRLSAALIKLGDKYKKKFGKPSTAQKGAIPKKTLVKMLEAIWIAFGANKRQARLNAEANYKQVMGESSGRPYAIQNPTTIDVNTGGNEAGGLFQFVPGTFDTWKVAGFNDRFNAVDNMLAAVNAQVNADSISVTGAKDGLGPRTVKVLADQGGWGPNGGSNPYLKKGKVIISGSVAGALTKPYPYKGKPQTDAISKAMKKQGYSDCYIAIVHDWYKLIKKYPPQEAIGGAGLLAGGVKKVTQPKKMVKCPKQIAHDSTSNPCYMDARILPNALYLSKYFGIYISDAYSGPAMGGAPASGCYVQSQCHTENGEHPLGIALDINGTVGNTKASAAAGCNSDWDSITRLANLTEKNGVATPPFRWVGYDGDSNHGCGNHLHLSWDHAPAAPYTLADWVLVFGTNAAPGGKGKQYNASAGGPGGGGTTPVGTNPRDINHRWPEADSADSWEKWAKAPQLKPYVVAALAEAAGRYMDIDIPGITMMLAIRGESLLKPGSSYDDPGGAIKGWGLWAITSPYGDNLGVPQMGGYKEMLNPVKNALVMTLFYLNIERGCGTWEGTWHGWDSFGAIGTNSHYRGKYNIANSLGGKSFAEVANSLGGQKLKRIKSSVCN